MGELSAAQLARVASRAIERSGVVAAISRLLGPKGRPRTFTLHTPLVLAVMSVYNGGDAHWTKIRAYACSLPENVQRQVGFLSPDGKQITQRQFTRYQTRFARLIESAPGIADHNHDHEGDPASTTPCPIGCPFERADVAWFLRRMCEGAVPPDFVPTGAAAHDATDIEVWAVPYGTADEVQSTTEAGPTSRDRHACWGHRSATSLHPTEFFYGLQLHATTNCRAEGTRTPSPGFVLGANLVPAGTNSANASVNGLVRTAAKFEITNLVVDRGYSYLEPASFARPLRAEGIELTVDHHPNDHKRYENLWPHNNARSGAPILQLDGSWFTSALPKRLLDLPFQIGFMRGARAQYMDLYDARAPYAFVIRERLGDGRIRIHGPARAGRLRCPNHPPSLRLPATIPLTDCTPDNPCSCASTRIVTIVDNPMEKIIQSNLFGTTTWVGSYNRRPQIETLFSLMKIHYANVEHGYTRVFDLQKHALLNGALLVAINIRIERQWRLFNDLTPIGDDPALIAEQHYMFRHQPRTRSNAKTAVDPAAVSPPAA